MISRTYSRVCSSALLVVVSVLLRGVANKKELVRDLIVKAKQVEYLINSLPEPEPVEEQVSCDILVCCVFAEAWT